MANALFMVQNYVMGMNTSAKICGVPKTTLLHLLKNQKYATGAKMFHGTTPSSDVEAEIVRHCLDLESMFFGKTANDFRRLAFEVVENSPV